MEPVLSVWYLVIWLVGFVLGAPCESSSKDFWCLLTCLYSCCQFFQFFFPPIPSVVDWIFFLFFLIFQVVGTVQYYDFEVSGSMQDGGFDCLSQ